MSKSLALIAGTNEVAQDPSAVGNMWKTVSMRIRAAKSELEEAGEDTEGMVESTSQLRDIVMGMTGFDIMKDDKTFKDIYDIVVGIGEQFGKLSDIDQASLLEKLAGKRQGNYLAAALNNIDKIKKAYNSAANESDGSAEKELANYQKGMQYSIDKFKAQFEELSNTAFDSSTLKGLTDIATEFLNVLTQIIDVGGGIPALLGAIGGIKFVKNLD